jgi:hypothetical protein
MWSIHDFLAYGLFAGCVTKGCVGWPPCGPTTESCFSKKLKTKLYGGSWMLFTTEPPLSKQNKTKKKKKKKHL